MTELGVGDNASSVLSDDGDYQKDLQNEFSYKYPEDIKQEDSSLSSELSPPPRITYLRGDNNEPPHKRIQLDSSTMPPPPGTAYPSSEN